MSGIATSLRIPFKQLVGRKRLLHRIHDLVSVIPITGCWMWLGVISPSGYAQTSVWDGTRNVGIRAYRVTYTEAKGAIPEGMHVDHLCRNRWCVNPEHLEVVEPKENLRRGVGAPAVNGRKTHCNSGHPLSGRNLVMDGGHRRCRACKADRSRELRERRSARGGVS